MKVLVQRVLAASVSVEGERVGSIGRGLLLFAGFTHEDDAREAGRLARKIVGLRIFGDENDRLQHSVVDVGGAMLAVPQFTLYGDLSRGRRPDFTKAMRPEIANALFDRFVSELGDAADAEIATGVFGAKMAVDLVNDGPFTLMLE